MLFGTPALKMVKPLDGTKLFAEFVDGSKRIYDVQRLFAKFPQFKIMLNKEFFDTVKKDGDYAVMWDDDFDLSSISIWENGEVVE